MISVIIGFYKRLDFLDLIFQSMGKQSDKNFEVIVAEDDDNAATLTYLHQAKEMYSFKILHVSQPDNGFRKTAILNKAIQIAKGDKLIFIDGDCLLHQDFIKEYQKAIKPGIFCYGRRAMVSESFTKKLLHDKSIQRLNYFSVLFSGGEWMAAGIYIPWKINQHKQHRRILGCNWGVCKNDILKVNGFDEDYTVAGVGEDFDIDWRLKKNDMKLFSMKNKAIVYHLYHKANHNEKDKQFVENMMQEKMKLGFYFCKNGIIKS